MSQKVPLSTIYLIWVTWHYYLQLDLPICIYLMREKQVQKCLVEKFGGMIYDHCMLSSIFPLQALPFMVTKKHGYGC